MKRTTMFVALTSALSLSLSAYAHGNGTSQDQSSLDGTSQQGQAYEQSQNADLVKQAQQKLSDMGKNVGTPDGRMEARTQQALTEYQQENGLQPGVRFSRQRHWGEHQRLGRSESITTPRSGPPKRAA